MAETPINEQEKLVKKLKRGLEGWREAILPMHSVLLWDKQWYPGLIFGTVTSLYTLMWLINPSVLTTFSCIGIVVTVGDFVVPRLMTKVNFGGPWTGYKEKTFEDICRNIVTNFNWTYYLLSYLLLMRDSSPRLFFSITLTILVFITWIGATVDNTFLCYIITLSGALLPGLQHRELPRKCLNRAFSFFNGINVEKKDM